MPLRSKCERPRHQFNAGTPATPERRRTAVPLRRVQMQAEMKWSSTSRTSASRRSGLRRRRKPVAALALFGVRTASARSASTSAVY